MLYKSLHVVFFSFFFVQLSFASSRIGISFPLKGKSFIRDKAGKIHTLDQALPLAVGDQIIAKEGLVQSYFIDGSQIKLGAYSSLKIVSYAYGKKNHAHYRMQNGVFRFHVGKIAEKAPENFKIATHMATIGIRGSAGELWTSDGSLGFVPGLKLIVDKNHKLFVRDKKERIFELREPEKGFKIDELSNSQWFKKKISIFELGFLAQAKRYRQRPIFIFPLRISPASQNYQGPTFPSKSSPPQALLGNVRQEMQDYSNKRRRKTKTYQKISEEKIKSSENYLKEIQVLKESSQSTNILKKLASSSLKIIQTTTKAIMELF